MRNDIKVLGLVESGDAERYLQLLSGDYLLPNTFMAIHECPGGTKDVKVRHGSFDDLESTLVEWNEDGYGIFCTVNETDGSGLRRKENIVRVRAVWIDLDGCKELPQFKLEPTIIVQTKNGYHAYYILSIGQNVSLSDGEAVNRSLASLYGGDMNAADAARVLRVPGFSHRKQEPFTVSIILDSGMLYSFDTVKEAYPLERTESPLETFSQKQGVDTDYGFRAAQSEAQRLSGVPVGKGLRNRAVTQASFRLGMLVGGGYLEEQTAFRMLVDACRDNQYLYDHGEKETAKVIISSLKAGMKHPRNGPEIITMEEGKLLNKNSSIGEIVRAGQTESVNFLGELLNKDSVLVRITKAIDRRIEMGFNPVPSPLSELNCVLGGGAPAGAVTLLGAPPGMGKSSLALAWAHRYSKSDKKPALYCSLELNELDLYSRLTTLIHRKSWIAVRCGHHRDELLSTVKSCDEIPFYVLTRGDVSNVEVLEQYIDTLAQKYGVAPLVVIDYMQLLIPSGVDREQWAVMSDISGNIAHCAQDTGSAILCITAINRQSYQITDKTTGKPDKYMALSAAKQSGRLEYDAEVIMGLQLFEEIDGKQFGWVCIAKNRSGGGAANIPVQYDGLSGNFLDASEDDLVRAVAKERESNRRVTLEDVREKLLDTLTANPTADIDSLCKSANVSRSKGREVFGKLISDGVIIKNHEGKFMKIR